MEAVALPQKACFEAAVTFARHEGILPAPESSHAIAAAVQEAERCRCGTLAGEGRAAPEPRTARSSGRGLASRGQLHSAT
jgi:hypothetical protein